ncbi:MAG: choice-of-anchor B family protein [Bacteroidetes bacterium]|nr:MAG: choice-of-anchor B family protein [Bacteroidota bacterium]
MDLGNPAQPIELQMLPLIPNIWRDIEVYGHYAYVSNEAGNGLRIINLENLPGQVVYKDTIIAGMNTGHTLHIDEKGYLYINGSDQFNGGIAILDLKPNPWKPLLVGAYTERYVHDCYVRGDTCYAAEINDGFLTIIDLENRAAPVVIGQRDYVNSFTHNTWLNDAGNICFTTDETGAAYVYAWDISDPANITEVDKIRSSLSNGESIPHNVYVKNDFLIMAYYRDGVVIFDASHPNTLVETGYYDTNPLSGDGFNGVWATYPYLPSGLILAADIEEGLVVLQPQYVRGCYLEGFLTDANTGATIEGVEVTFSGGNPELSDPTGYYTFGIADSGTYTLNFSRYGYYTATASVNLDNGITQTLNVALTPLARTPLVIQVRDSLTHQALADARVQAAPANDPNLLEWVSTGNGTVTENEFVLNTYVFQAGKWGYHTQEKTITILQGQDTLYFDLKPGYRDEFALDLGWEILGNAQDGPWERGEPKGTYFQGGASNPDTDLTGDIGDQAYVTGNQGNTFSDDDVDRGITVLYSPVMDLSGYNDPYLRYAWWLVNFDAANGQQGNESLKIELSSNLGALPIATYSAAFSNNWTIEDSIRILNYFPLFSPLRLRITIQDLNPQNIVEAAFDGFEVFEGKPDVTAIDTDRETGKLWAYVEGSSVSVHYQPFTKGSDLELELCDLRGAVLQRVAVPGGGGVLHLDASQLARGMYMLHLRGREGLVMSRKFVY